MSYKIFISYSGADSQWVQLISDNAQNIGLNVYMYKHDPQPGKMIAAKVQTAIKNSQALVVLLTHNSQYSPYVQQEIGFAQGEGKLVIPLVEPGVSPDCLAMLQGKEYITFDTTSPEEALSVLLAYLKKLKSAKESDQAILMGLGALALLAIFFSKNK